MGLYICMPLLPRSTSFLQSRPHAPQPIALIPLAPPLPPQSLDPKEHGCIRVEGSSEAAPEAVGQAVGGAKAVGGRYCR